MYLKIFHVVKEELLLGLLEESRLHPTFSDCYHSMVIFLFSLITPPIPSVVKEQYMIAPQVNMITLNYSKLHSIRFS